MLSLAEQLVVLLCQDSRQTDTVRLDGHVTIV